MKLHALVDDLGTARAAAEGGATVIQLRLKNEPTETIVQRGAPFRELCRSFDVMFVVNDDVEAALRLGAGGVHLGREDQGAERAVSEGLLLGISAAGVEEALAAERTGATYVGAGPVWATPSKDDAAPPVGLGGLAAICDSVSIPVVAIGGVDTSNASDCLLAGAAGVAVVRAAADARALREVLDNAPV